MRHLCLILALSAPAATYGASPPTLGTCGCYRLDGQWWVALHQDGAWTRSTETGDHWAGRWSRRGDVLWVSECRLDGGDGGTHTYSYAIRWGRLSRAKGQYPPAR